jgi:hypothetical protein
MNVKEAVKIAKSYVSDVFADEGVTDLGLEEVEHDDREGAWNITVAFSRPLNLVGNTFTTITGQTSSAPRAYKVVHIRESDGEVMSVLND